MPIALEIGTRAFGAFEHQSHGMKLVELSMVLERENVPVRRIGLNAPEVETSPFFSVLFSKILILNNLHRGYRPGSS